jgi:hypothetical protein
VRARGHSLLGAVLAAAIALVALASTAVASTRQPPREAFSAGAGKAVAFDSAARPRSATLRAIARRARHSGAPAAQAAVSSTRFGAAEIATVAATLRSLDHGPELAALSVYVAAPDEIRQACGATVVACYVPAERRMVVSGLDRPIAGVPREFAIAHEYGHHIANSRAAADGIPGGGTLRWATYERVCQLTRRGRVVPDAGPARYWDDPEEAFADAYARLNRPGAALDWQYSSLLRPTPAALAKLRADVVRPYSGPVTRTWVGTLGGGRPWRASRSLRTRLDGRVSVSLRAHPGAPLALVLRDRESNRVLAHTATAPDGTAHLVHSNCGRDTLRLELRATTAATPFEATITRP